MRLAADRHDAQAMYLYAGMVAEGRGVPKDKARAEVLMAIAAEAGDADAQFWVGMSALRTYSAGATTDPRPALQWLERAAAQGLPQANYTLGIFYIISKPETGYQDPQRGMAYLRQCAEVMLTPECAFAYAFGYAIGSAGARDPVKAYAFYLLSDDAKPYDGAKQRLKELAAQMSPEQIAQAQAYAVEVKRRIAEAARSRALQAGMSSGTGQPK